MTSIYNFMVEFTCPKHVLNNSLVSNFIAAPWGWRQGKQLKELPPTFAQDQMWPCMVLMTLMAGQTPGCLWAFAWGLCFDLRRIPFNKQEMGGEGTWPGVCREAKEENTPHHRRSRDLQKAMDRNPQVGDLRRFIQNISSFREVPECLHDSDTPL